MSEAPPKLEWRGVAKAFDGAPVLRSLDLSVAAGRSLVIIGGSGQGKSVAIKIAMGLLNPDSGQILIDGRDVVAMPARERRQLPARFGMLFQGAALFDSLSVWENVAFRLINADGAPRKKAKVRALEALDRVRIGREAAELYPSLSLLRELAQRAVPITTASDTHGAGRVAERSADLRALAVAAGYGELRAYRERAGRPVPIMQGAGVGT